MWQALGYGAVNENMKNKEMNIPEFTIVLR
jgi:hypothetical protein